MQLPLKERPRLWLRPRGYGRGWSRRRCCCDVAFLLGLARKRGLGMGQGPDDFLIRTWRNKQIENLRLYGRPARAACSEWAFRPPQGPQMGPTAPKVLSAPGR